MESWSIANPKTHHSTTASLSQLFFHDVLDQERPYLRGVGEHFRIGAVFVGLAPGFVLRIGAAGEMAEVRLVRTDPHAVTESAIGKCRAKPLVDDFDQRRDVLHVV